MTNSSHEGKKLIKSDDVFCHCVLKPLVIHLINKSFCRKNTIGILFPEEVIQDLKIMLFNLKKLKV
jgi:hypothetical protein